jgi:hypothetical protein
MTEGRAIAIGDVHGCSAALAALVRAIDPTELDTLVFLRSWLKSELRSWPLRHSPLSLARGEAVGGQFVALGSKPIYPFLILAPGHPFLWGVN